MQKLLLGIFVAIVMSISSSAYAAANQQFCDACHAGFGDIGACSNKCGGGGGTLPTGAYSGIASSSGSGGGDGGSSVDKLGGTAGVDASGDPIGMVCDWDSEGCDAEEAGKKDEPGPKDCDVTVCRKCTGKGMENECCSIHMRYQIWPDDCTVIQEEMAKRCSSLGCK
jgi:hypothetical protein